MNTVVDLIVEKLQGFLQTSDSSPFNYERNLLVDKAPYLDAFVEGKPFPPFEVEMQMSSKCNLQCRWCIGGELQEKSYVMRLPDHIKGNHVDEIVKGIINFRIDNLDIEIVKFSGFIGEPLLVKDATLRAMRLLIGAGKKVGLFTNGVLMDDHITRETLVNIDYVHISLDAGPSSFFWLKESSKQNAVYTQETFNKVLNNIKELNKTRKIRRDRSKLRINIGYVVVPGNHDQIYATAKLVKEAGADSIRFKCDIGERFDLQKGGVLDTVYQEIEKVKQELEDSLFAVREIHSRKDIEDKTYKAWQCDKHERGCFYHNFLATVGSDGNLYLCDHNTMPSAVPLGSVIDKTFEEVWKSERRKYLIDGMRYICHCGVCPPFGNRVNFFLKEIHDLREEYGIPCMKEAINKLRTEYTNQMKV